LERGAWSVVPSTIFPPGHIGKLVTVDDAGNGWAISGSPGKGAQPDALIRLLENGAGRIVPLAAPATGFSPEPPLLLSALDVNPDGYGWAAGSLYLGRYKVMADMPLEEQYTVVPIRLKGDTATVLPEEVVSGSGYNLPYSYRRSSMRPTAITIGPDGVLALLGGVGGHGTGMISYLHEPWPHSYPPSAAPMPGPGRCFRASAYCMRGAFAQYWEANGGVACFGYPITTEVQEEVHTRMGGDFQTRVITVQYTQYARFECADWACEPNDVTLGRLGPDLARITLGAPTNVSLADLAAFKPRPAERIRGKPWIPETQHFLGPPFLRYWRDTGDVRRHGYPISEPFEERSSTGRFHTVQYFERSKLEYGGGRVTNYPIGSELFYLTYGYHP
jgi:hypothetical protein